MNMLPLLFAERLKMIIPEENFLSVMGTFDLKRDASLRWNSLKANQEEVEGYFKDKAISYSSPTWYRHAYILAGVESGEVSRWDLTNSGKIYIQSQSSMLPVVVLNPQPGEMILDLCAAPGSKTSQIAAHMNNDGVVVAVDAVKERFFRLKSVMNLLDARIVQAKCLDGRRYRSDGNLLDRILVDAPCSSEGRFKTYDKKTIGYWSLRKIKEMVQKQRGLLLNACRLVKPGGVVLYSTCTFAPEENEGVVDWVLRKSDGEVSVEPISLDGFKRYPVLRQWGERTFDGQVQHCCRVLPTTAMEGFFMVKLVRKDYRQ